LIWIKTEQSALALGAKASDHHKRCAPLRRVLAQDGLKRRMNGLAPLDLLRARPIGA